MNHSYYSQKGIIIRGFQDQIAPLYVSYFMKGPYFVGYKAGTRISELCKEGLIENITNHNKLGVVDLYIITEKGRNYEIKKPTLIERILHNLKIIGN